MLERGVIVISGKILEKPFSLDVIEQLRTAIERRFSERGVMATRLVATLSQERFIAAPYFLDAGFEVMPADDEDMQAVAFISSEVFSANAPNEVALLIAQPEPVALMRTFAFKTRRTLITNDKPSENLIRNTEEILNIREILSKEGIDWSSLGLQTWDEWVADFDASISGGSRAADPEEKTPNVDELCQETEEVEVDDFSIFIDSAVEWNDSLEKILLANGLKCSAYKTMEKLDELFPGILNFYLDRARRGNFAELLGSNVRFLPTSPENETAFLCHITHPEMEQVSALDAIEKISIGGGASASDVDAKRDAFKQSTFEELAMRADIMRQQCEWTYERKQLVERGASFDDAIKPRDRELDELARERGAYLWLIRAEELFWDPSQYLELASVYDFASQTFSLFSRVIAENDVDSRLLVKIMQLAVNAQCMIKTALTDLGVPLGSDSVQGEAFKLLKKYRQENLNGSVVFQNMKMSDLLRVDALSDLIEERDQLEADFECRAVKTKDRRKLEDSISYCVKKVQDNPNFQKEFWEQIVATTTILCEHYKTPYSNKFFRVLYDILPNLPEDLETTEAFGRVVQELELEEQRKADKEEELFSFAVVEPQYSDELLAVRKRYSGSKIVFIGGEPKDHLRTRLEKSYDVEVLWTETDHGESLDRFGAPLRDPDVKLFLIYIPWCSHKHSEELSSLVKATGKDFVRLRKGTNPESIARAICDQLSIDPYADMVVKEEVDERKD